jgi:FKBP-type peptidyl-prolyl cis-trans isomerase (trigger factor)
MGIQPDRLSRKRARRTDSGVVRRTDRAKADLVAAPARPTVVVHEEEPMKLSNLIGGGLLALAAAVAAPDTVRAEATKTYQVTGPVLEVTDSTITVQKGKEKWQIARDKETKAPSDVKVGDKVTIEYTMSAKNIESKGPTKAK